jgi:hypothetical protein
MTTIKITVYSGIVIIFLTTFMFLASCKTEAGTVSKIQVTTTTQSTTTPTSTISPTTTTQSTTTPTSTISPTVTTTATTTVTTTVVEPEDVYKPVVGDEHPVFSWKQDKWTILQFDYETVHEASDWHYPWSLTIKNETSTDLDLTAYILYIGFHNWIGYLTETPFTLTTGETKTLTGEDILADVLVQEIIYVEYMNVEVHVAER